MLIQWLGQSCFKIQIKSAAGETVILTDPYLGKFIGLKQPRYNADIVTVSHDHADHGNFKDVKGTKETDKPFVIKGPGEYEFRNVFVYGVPSTHDDAGGKERGPNTIYLFSAENIKIAHLGDLGQKELTTQQLEYIEGTDILLIPVGGKYTLNASEAAKLVKNIEPRIVIPMHYKIPGLQVDIDGVDKFIKEIGNKKEEFDKLRLTHKDLPQEETKLIILKA